MTATTPPTRLLQRSLEMRERAIAADVARREARARQAPGAFREVFDARARQAPGAFREVFDARARLAQVRRELRGLRRSRAH
jgi:hypothetical protein